MEAMLSHSEPTDVAEPSAPDNGKSCVSCKSTDGAIPNLAAPEVYNLNEDALPEPEAVKEWGITCTVCHNPHTTALRVEDEVQLCANCHNGREAEADGAPMEYFYPSWEMYSSSDFATGVHPVELTCTDCHMAQSPVDSGANGPAGPDHTFDFDPALLSDPETENGCYACHEENLASLVAERQENISGELQALGQLEVNAGEALETANGTEAYPELEKAYNNALFHIAYVENDGSLGIHNVDKAAIHLETARGLLENVTEATGTGAGEEPTEEPEGPTSEEVPGFGAAIAFAGVLGALYLGKMKTRPGKYVVCCVKMALTTETRNHKQNRNKYSFNKILLNPFFLSFWEAPPGKLVEAIFERPD